MFLKSEPREQKEAIRHFYDRLSPHFKSLWGPHLHDGYYQTGEESRERAQEQLVEFLASKAQIPKNSRVLDIGCGLGATSVWLAENWQCRPHGVTLSPQQVEMAENLARERGVEASFQVMDAEQLAFDEVFDALWMVGVLGHLPSQENFLRKASTLVRPGGRFLLADWTVDSEVSQSQYQKIVEPVIRGMLMPTITTAADYSTWLTESGFRLIESLDITGETRKTWDHGVKIVQAPQVFKLVKSLGKDALELVTAIYQMRKAMKLRLIRYTVVVAERL